MSKNITLTIDEAVLDGAKQFAVARQTSVNRLVRDYLAGLVEGERRKDDARAALLALAREKSGDLGTQTPRREALYDR